MLAYQLLAARFPWANDKDLLDDLRWRALPLLPPATWRWHWGCGLCGSCCCGRWRGVQKAPTQQVTPPPRAPSLLCRSDSFAEYDANTVHNLKMTNEQLFRCPPPPFPRPVPRTAQAACWCSHPCAWPAATRSQHDGMHALPCCRWVQMPHDCQLAPSILHVQGHLVRQVRLRMASLGHAVKCAAAALRCTLQLGVAAAALLASAALHAAAWRRCCCFARLCCVAAAASSHTPSGQAAAPMPTLLPCCALRVPSTVHPLPSPGLAPSAAPTAVHPPPPPP
jgi:hypothetical protein